MSVLDCTLASLLAIVMDSSHALFNGTLMEAGGTGRVDFTSPKHSHHLIYAPLYVPGQGAPWDYSPGES